MISLLLIYSYIIFIFFGVGVLTCIFLAKLNVLKGGYKELTPDFFLLLGLIVTTTLVAFWSVFLPVNWILNLTLFGIVYIFVVLNRKIFAEILSAILSTARSEKNAFVIAVLSLLPLFIILVLFSLNSIQSFDTGLYHAQYIQWIERFRTPPGLAWIHSRFAFNSHFHVISALFSFSSFNFRNSAFTPMVFYPLNSFIFLLFALRSAFKITKGLMHGNHFQAVLYAVLLLTSFCIFGAKAQSPMPDIAMAILTYYLFLFFVEHFEFSSEWTGHQILLVGLILLLPTFKLSAGLVVILLIPICWKKNFKKLIPIGVLGFVIVLPFFIRNIIISGYPIYALPQLDIAPVEWKIPAENVLVDNAVIKAWARIPYKSYKEVLVMPFSEWFPVWRENYSIDLNDYILKFCLASPLIMLAVFFIRRKTYDLKLLIAYGVLVINLLFWFVSAPDPRFAWGFLYFNFAFVLASIIALVRFRGMKYAVGLAILCFMYRSFLYTSEEWPALARLSQHKSLLYFPVQIESAPLTLFKEATFPLWTPTKDDGRCFNASIPCTPYPLRRVRMRGESLADGFVYDEDIK